MQINLPILALRDYQQEVWDAIFVRGVRKVSQEWHRRAGKDLLDLNIQIAYAMIDIGNHWFLLPETQQVRNAIWEGSTKDGIKYLDYFPPEIVHKKDNQQMKVYLKDPRDPAKIGSIISFLGGDRYDKRVGAGLKSCVLSENSLQKPNLYDLAVEPMLRETNGLLLTNFTPRGYNHATKLHDFFMSEPGCYAKTLTIKDTGLVTDADLDELRRRGVPEEIIQQEYFCSREGANFGSYLGDVLQKNKEKVTNLLYDPAYPVHTLWDLGISDSMAIWFVQFVGNNIHIIDYYENSNYGLGHYAQLIKSKQYSYAMHHLPHDGRKREMSMDEKAITIEEQLRRLEVAPITIHKPRNDLYGIIQRVRMLIPRCFFNAEKTKDGYEALKQYQREWDEGRQIFKQTPLHNWCSHGFDAFSIICDVENQNFRATGVKRPAQSKQWNGKFR